jgi:hypothetical protein
MKRRVRIIVAIAALGFAWSPRANAETPSLRAGAIELGLSGALTIVEGSTRASVGVDGSGFARAPGGLAIASAEIGYSHVNDLDILDAGVLIGWTRPIGDSSLYPFVALAGGVRQEWIGSFADARYPVGFDAGLRALVSSRANIRVSYRLRRVLNDPVEDFTEHEIRIGIALLFKNPAANPPKPNGRAKP